MSVVDVCLPFLRCVFSHGDVLGTTFSRLLKNLRNHKEAVPIRAA